MANGSDPDWIEIPVFVHGVTQDVAPGNHDAQYRVLFDGVKKKLKTTPGPHFTWEHSIRIEWGWNSGQSAQNDRFLAQAEAAVGAQVRDIGRGTWDFTINPFRWFVPRLREAFLYGFADIFYYVSEDGEQAVRGHVFQEIGKALARLSGGQKLSLTFFTHSAGTVIAHDLLYHLFSSNAKPPKGQANSKEFRDACGMARQGRLRVRRLYTMGSPITPLFFRANSLLLAIAGGNPLDPQDLGFSPSADLPEPRWLNFWDKDDVISFPLAFNYDPVQGQTMVSDIHADVGDSFPGVHEAYWGSAKVAKLIAANW